MSRISILKENFNSCFNDIFLIIFKFVLTFILIFFTTGYAHAMQYKIGDEIIISSDESINEQLFFASEIFEFNGTINGDIAGAAREVKISGEVNGDLWIAAQLVEISGNISGSGVIVAQQIIVEGKIDGDFLGVSEDFELNKNSEIFGELNFYCERISIESPIAGDLKGAAKNVKINANINGDVDISVENLEIGPESIIKGNLQYKSIDKIDDINKPKIIGQIFHKLPEVKVKEFWNGWVVFFKGISLISYLLIGLIIMLPFKKHTELVIYQQQKNFWVCLLVGFISFVLIPILIMILCITIIGLPLAVLCLIIFLIIWYLCSMFVMTYMGRILIGLFKKDFSGSILISFITGLIVIELLETIPIAGLLVTLLVWFLGVGAFIISRKVLLVELKEKGII